jgi:MFS transporter, ACS family, glucarate transporter
MSLLNLKYAKTIPYRYRVIVLLCSLTTLTYLDRICISIVGVRVKSEFDLSNTQFGWVLAAFSLAYAVFEIPAGVLGDRIGPRAMFIRIVSWWSVFTILTGFTGGLISLIIIRFLFGMGEAGTYPNCLIVLSRWFPVNEHGRILSWIGIGSQIGSAIAPLIIVPLAVAYGWRMPFYVNGLIGFIWVAVCYSWFRDFPAQMKKLPEKEKSYIEANSRYSPHASQISWLTIIKQRNTLSLMMMYFCCQWANYFFVAWMPVYLQEGRHFSENEMKTITFILFVAGFAGLLIAGFCTDWLLKKRGVKFTRRFMGMTGLSLCGFFLLIAALSPINMLTALCLILSNAFFSFGVMSSYAVCADIGGNNAGTVTGAMNFCGQMGAFFLAIIFGKVVDLTHNYDAPLFILFIVELTGCLLWLAINPTKPLRSSILTKKHKLMQLKIED